MEDGERIRYGDPGWDDMEQWGADVDARPATEAEAHVEWHLNSGVPMGQPCPWDACDPGWDEPEGEAVDDEPPFGSFPEEAGTDLSGAPYGEALRELRARAEADLPF
jgi:hypothetical protein